MHGARIEVRPLLRVRPRVTCAAFFNCMHGHAQGGQASGQARQQPRCQGGRRWGACSRLVAALKEMVLLPLLYPDLFVHLGIAPPRSAADIYECVHHSL